MAIDRTTRSREPPIRANLATALVVIAAGLFLFLALPLLVRAQGLAWAWLALPAVLATVPHWALIHEAIHDHLLPERRANEHLGRLLALLFLAPFDTLRFGHLSHHALNAKAAERPEFYDPARCSRLRAALLYYPRLLGGLYLVEIASGPASFLPRRLLRPIVRRAFYAESEEAGAMADRAQAWMARYAAGEATLAEGLGSVGEDVSVRAPVFVDYGVHIAIGAGTDVAAEAADRALDPTGTPDEVERVVRALRPHIGARLPLPDGTFLRVIAARPDGPTLAPAGGRVRSSATPSSSTRPGRSSGGGGSSSARRR